MLQWMSLGSRKKHEHFWELKSSNDNLNMIVAECLGRRGLNLLSVISRVYFNLHLTLLLLSLILQAV
jgi:hypothetical protein